MGKHHGMSHTRIYKIWKDMRQRCNNKNCRAYKHYGGRGIKVYPEWNDFINFFNWAMSNGYEENLSIERKNVDGNYEPNNCCWIPMIEQHYNTRRTHYITHNGIRKTAKEWAVEYNINERLLYDRIQSGYSFEDALHGNLYNKRERILTYHGQTMNITEWAKTLGMNRSTLNSRLNRDDLTIEEAMKPVNPAGKFIPYNGEIHNIVEWSKITGIPKGVIADRLRRGWEIKDIFTLPLDSSLNYKKYKRERG